MTLSAPLSSDERALVEPLATRAGDMHAALAHLVAIPTGPGCGDGLARARETIVKRLVAIGGSVREVPGSPRPAWLREGAAPAPADHPQSIPPLVIVSNEHASPRARVLFCGHVDTVHEASSDFREFRPLNNPHHATGPGCADMKGGLIVALEALEAAHRAGLPLSWTFAIVSDEETGSFHSDSALRAEATRKDAHGRAYNAALVFEPAMSDGSLVVERPGSGQFMIECRGKAAHVGRDFVHGVSAVRAIAERVLKASDWADPAQGLIVSIGPIEGGSATNIVPESARAWGNIRCFSACAQGRVEECLRAMNSALGQLPSTNVTWTFNRPAKPQTPAVLALANLARECAHALGQQLPFGATGGVCDGNNIQAGGVPTIDTLGVRGGGLHTRDEWIDLTSLVDRAQLAALLLSRLCQHPLR